MNHFERRNFIKLSGIGLVATALWPVGVNGQNNPKINKKAIPSTGELITVIGMGTWQTFNVGSDSELLKQRTSVLKTFFAEGGQMIDSSPMYGSSQSAVGYGLRQLGHPQQLFSADKVWTRDGNATREQISQSAGEWNRKHFDLMQVHNLLSWEPHLETLEAMKKAGEVRYIGITTSHGRRHTDLEKIMQSRNLDFVQLTYNMIDREVESRLLPLAKEKGIAVIANRPFQGGYLIDRLQRNKIPLPQWAGDIACVNWPQFLLKFIVSHPAVTCAIPATTRVEHMKENMGAAIGPIPDATMRRKMLDYIQRV